MACNCMGICDTAIPDVPQQQGQTPMAPTPVAAPRSATAAPARVPIHIKDDPRTSVTFEHMTNIATHLRKTLDEATKARYDSIMQDNCTEEQQKRVDQLIVKLKTLVAARNIIAELLRGE